MRLPRNWTPVWSKTATSAGFLAQLIPNAFLSLPFEETTLLRVAFTSDAQLLFLNFLRKLVSTSF